MNGQSKVTQKYSSKYLVVMVQHLPPTHTHTHTSKLIISLRKTKYYVCVCKKCDRRQVFGRIIFFYKVLKLSLQEKNIYIFFFSFPFCETEGIVVRMAIQLPLEQDTGGCAGQTVTPSVLCPDVLSCAYPVRLPFSA